MTQVDEVQSAQTTYKNTNKFVFMKMEYASKNRVPTSI